jgi:membrane protein YdbS with pleckstrin-like domain/predicted Ser/Thr protein kinase
MRAFAAGKDCLRGSSLEMPAFDFVLAGRYKLAAPLGEGGMAAVYRGRDLRLNREVAIKVLHEDLTRDPDFLARFEREAQLVASLSHPNIVSVYDVGEDRGTNFIVMEYVRGRTLKEVIEREGSLTSGRAVAIMLPVLGALGYAHERGLIHRDIKPQNILVTSDGTPRLADFGIARLVDGSTTRTAAILGSAHYLSPEQSRGEGATARSDIYACGVVLYEMLSGRPPFEGSNALAVAHQHLNTPPALLRPTLPDLQPGLEQAVMRALAKDPDDRFGDAPDFARGLEEYQETDETALQPLGSPERAVFERAPAHPAVARHETRLVVRRSTRKAYLLALVLTGAVVAAAYAASFPFWSGKLPQYPSAPYAVLPAAFAAYALFSWFNARSRVYSMDANAAVVQWGLIGHHRFGVPLRQIVSLELKQSPIDRVLGVGTVELTARDQHGNERRLVMEDLPEPRETYDELLHLLSRAARDRLSVAEEEEE